MKKIMVAVVMVLMCGCSKYDYSKNMQVATVRSISIPSVSFYLDQVNVKDYEAKKVKVIEVCDMLEKFIATGAVKELPLNKVKEKLEEFLKNKGIEYPIVDLVIDNVFVYISAQRVDLSKVNPWALELVGIGLEEIKGTATAHKKAWRPLTDSEIE